jgi:heat shock protein HslJ
VRKTSIRSIRSTRWAGAVAVMVALMVMGVAGCGSDDSSEASDESATSDSGSAVTADDLEGSTYVSTSVTGEELVEGSTINLSFEGPRMQMSAGCNIISAAYEINDGTLAWTGEPAATMMACPDDLTAQDQWLIKFFQDGVTATSDGSTLTLANDDVTIELSSP